MKTISNNMRQTAKRSTFKTDRDFRLTSRASGERVARPFVVTPDLSDRTLFTRVNQYRMDPNVFAVTTQHPLGLHELFRFEGVTYKVARVERIEGDTWEIKGVVFGRYQG